jgi:prevent-host-death family protein
MHTISATALQRNYGDILDDALEGPVIIKKHSRETHAIINIREFRMLQKARDTLDDILLGMKIDKAKKTGKYVGIEEVAKLLEQNEAKLASVQTSE